jgi:hypothetical protein
MHLTSCDTVVCVMQGASALTPGDAKAFKALLRTLPIESALTSSTPGKSPTAGGNRAAMNSSLGGMSAYNRSMSPLSTTARSTASGGGLFH